MVEVNQSVDCSIPKNQSLAECKAPRSAPENAPKENQQTFVKDSPSIPYPVDPSSLFQWFPLAKRFLDLPFLNPKELSSTRLAQERPREERSKEVTAGRSLRVIGNVNTPRQDFIDKEELNLRSTRERLWYEAKDNNNYPRFYAFLATAQYYNENLNVSAGALRKEAQKNIKEYGELFARAKKGPEVFLDDKSKEKLFKIGGDVVKDVLISGNPKKAAATAIAKATSLVIKRAFVYGFDKFMRDVVGDDPNLQVYLLRNALNQRPEKFSELIDTTLEKHNGEGSKTKSALEEVWNRNFFNPMNESFSIGNDYRANLGNTAFGTHIHSKASHMGIQELDKGLLALHYSQQGIKKDLSEHMKNTQTFQKHFQNKIKDIDSRISDLEAELQKTTRQKTESYLIQLGETEFINERDMRIRIQEQGLAGTIQFLIEKKKDPKARAQIIADLYEKEQISGTQAQALAIIHQVPSQTVGKKVSLPKQEELNNLKTQLLVEQRQNQIAANQAKIKLARSSIAVFTVIFGSKNPKMVHEISQAAHIALDVASLISQTADKGTLNSILSGGDATIMAINIGLSVVKLFMKSRSGPSETEIILAEIKKLKEEIQKLKKEMYDRFDAIEYILEDMLFQLEASLYEVKVYNQQILVTTQATLANTANIAARQISGQALAAAEKYDSDRIKFTELKLACTSNNTKAIKQETFDECIRVANSRVQLHSKDCSNTNICNQKYDGGLGKRILTKAEENNEPISESEFLAEFILLNHPKFMENPWFQARKFNYLIEYAWRNLGIPVPGKVKKVVLVNPETWIEAAGMLVETINKFPHFAKKLFQPKGEGKKHFVLKPQVLREIAQDGRNIRDIFRTGLFASPKEKDVKKFKTEANKLKGPESQTLLLSKAFDTSAASLQVIFRALEDYAIRLVEFKLALHNASQAYIDDAAKKLILIKAHTRIPLFSSDPVTEHSYYDVVDLRNNKIRNCNEKECNEASFKAKLANTDLRLNSEAKRTLQEILKEILPAHALAEGLKQGQLQFSWSLVGVESESPKHYYRHVIHYEKPIGSTGGPSSLETYIGYKSRRNGSISIHGEFSGKTQENLRSQGYKITRVEYHDPSQFRRVGRFKFKLDISFPIYDPAKEKVIPQVIFSHVFTSSKKYFFLKKPADSKKRISFNDIGTSINDLKRALVDLNDDIVAQKNQAISNFHSNGEFVSKHAGMANLMRFKMAEIQRDFLLHYDRLARQDYESLTVGDSTLIQKAKNLEAAKVALRAYVDYIVPEADFVDTDQLFEMKNLKPTHFSVGIADLLINRLDLRSDAAITLVDLLEGDPTELDTLDLEIWSFATRIQKAYFQGKKKETELDTRLTKAIGELDALYKEFGPKPKETEATQ